MKRLAFFLSVGLFAASPLTPPYSINLADSNSWHVLLENLTNGKNPYGKSYLARDGGRAFDFEAPGTKNSDNYFYYQIASKGGLNASQCASGSCTLAVTAKITGQGPFIQSDPTDFPPAQFRLMIASPSWDRFWSHSDNTVVVTSYLTAPGVYTFSVPLTSQWWDNVNGQNGTSVTAEWASVVNGIGFVGVTFGGLNFDGHGNQGVGTFEILSASIF